MGLKTKGRFLDETLYFENSTLVRPSFKSQRHAVSLNYHNYCYYLDDLTIALKRVSIWRSKYRNIRGFDNKKETCDSQLKNQ